MDAESSEQETPVTITSQGMVMIPTSIRKRYHLNEGDKLVIIEEEGTFRLIPLVPEQRLRAKSCGPRELIAMRDKDRVDEQELES